MQGCTTQISWRDNFFFVISKGQSWYVITLSMGVFAKERSKIHKIWGFVGQIKSFCGPHLARGPYVVHAWVNVWFRPFRGPHAAYGLLVWDRCFKRIYFNGQLKYISDQAAFLMFVPSFFLQISACEESGLPMKHTKNYHINIFYYKGRDWRIGYDYIWASNSLKMLWKYPWTLLLSLNSNFMLISQQYNILNFQILIIVQQKCNLNKY